MLAKINDIGVNTIRVFSCPVSMKSIQLEVFAHPHGPLDGQTNGRMD